MVEDLIFRFLWTLTVSVGELEIFHSEILKLILSVCEVFRCSIHAVSYLVKLLPLLLFLNDVSVYISFPLFCAISDVLFGISFVSRTST